MANKKNVEANKKNTEIKNKKSNELEQKKPTKKKKLRLHSHLKVNIPLFQSLMMILPSLAKHTAAEDVDNSGDNADQVAANNVTAKDSSDHHGKMDSSAVTHQEAQTSDSDVNSTLSASHAPHGSSSHLVPSHHLSTLSHPQVHYIPSVSMPTISSGSNGQPTHSNAPTTTALPVTFMPEVIKGTYGELHVDANGQYTFVLNPKSPQYILLNQHQQGTDHFLLHLSNGSSVIVQVPVTGKQDTPSISGDLTGVVTEDHNIDSQGLLHANGKIDVIDPDQNESSVAPEVISGKYGSLTIDSDGHWQYQVDNSLSNVQALTGATSLHESFTIHTKDGTPQTIDMTIGGNDDNAVITGVDAGTVTEDLTTQVQGQLSVTDSDLGEDHFQASQVTSNFGTLSITKDGAWTYNLDSNNLVVQGLGQGSTATDIVTVYSAEGTAHQVMVTINGTNDKAVIGGTDSGTVTEESQLQTSGTLTVTDVDTGEAHFSDTDIVGNLGTLHLTDSGAWTYNLDNTNPTVQALGANKTATDTITVHSADGIPHQVTITVNGTNDSAVIGGTNSGAVTEESQLQTSGTLTVTDVDTGEAHFSNTDIKGSLGTLHLTDSGAWTYDLDNSNPAVQALAKGQHAKDIITVHSTDGTPHQVAITVNGTNDAAQITGTTTGAVTEDRIYGMQWLVVNSHMHVTDTDAGEAHFDPVLHAQNNAGIGYISTLGASVVIAPDGDWHYQLDNNIQQVQSLGQGQSYIDKVTVHTADGTTQELQITITGTNDAPTVTGSRVLPAGTEDQTLRITQTQLLAGATDIDKNDSGTLHVDAVTADHGTVTHNADGSFTFHPDQDYNGQVKFTYDIKDAHGGSVQATASSTLAAAGDAATISGVDTGDVHEGHTFTARDGSMTGSYVDDRSPDHQHGNIGKLWNDEIHTDGHLSIVDADAGESYAQTGTYYGTHGRVILQTNGDWTYYASIGQDATGRAIDHLGKGESLTDTVTVKSTDGTTHDIVVTIHGDNDSPYCSSEVQLNSGKEDLAQTITASELLANTIDVDTNDIGKLTIANLHADHGSIQDNKDGTYTFTPTKDYNGQVHFTYDVQDAHGGVTHTGATTSLSAVGDTAIIGGQDTFAVQEDHNLTLNSGNTIIYNGQLTITDADAGEDHFDGNLHQNQQTGTWDTGYTTQEGGKLILQSNGSYRYEIDNSLAKIQSLGSSETLIDTVTVRSADGTPHQIQVTIQGDNDAPVVSSAVTLTAGTEDTDVVLHASDLLANATDIDHDDAGKLSVANLIADHGTITDNHDGTFTFHPTQDYNGKVSFTYDVQDAHGGSVATSASITLAPTRDSAVITGTDTGKIIEDHNVGPSSLHPVAASGLLSVTDPDAGQDHFQVNLLLGEQAIHDPFGGYLRITPNGAWGYAVANSRLQSLAEGEVEKVVYRVYSADHTAHDITITVTGTNDQPTITAKTLAHGTEDTHYQMQASQFGFTDIDTGDTLHSIAITDLPPATQGKFVLDGHDVTTGQQIPTADISKLQFVPAQDFNGDVQFKYTVNDGHVDSQEATNTLHIDAVGDKAVIAGQDTGSLDEFGSHGSAYSDITDRSPDYHHSGSSNLFNQILSVTGDLTITDPDNNEAQFLSPAHQIRGQFGLLSISEQGHWVYQVSAGTSAAGRAIDKLGAGEKLTDTITIHSKDGTPHDIVITIHGDNDRPYCSSEVILNAGTEDTRQTLTTAQLLANTVDVDKNDAGLLSIENLHADHGSILDNQDGTFTFTPTKDYNGQVHFTYDVQDAHGGATHTGASTTLLASNDPATLPSTQAANSVTEDNLKSGTNNNELWSGWKNLDVQDIDSPSEAKVTQIEVNGVKHTVPTDFAMNLASTHGTFNFTHSTDGHNKWSYSADNSHTEIQQLSSGDSLTDTVTLITADGTRIPLTAKIQGTDDHVMIDTPDALTASLGTAVEDKVTTISGTLLAHDADSKDSVTFAAGDNPGTYGTLHVDANGQWHYDLDHAKANLLQQGEIKAEGFDITAISTDGSTATKHIEVFVQGSSDSATISVTSNPDVHEDQSGSSVEVISGKLTALDPDHDQSAFSLDVGKRHDPFNSGVHGGLHISKDGSWTYTVNNSQIQNLAAGQVEHVQYNVHTVGGDSHVIDIKVVGTNDAPTISATTLAHGTEDTHYQMQASQFGFTDIDTGDTLHSIAITDLPPATQGKFVLDGHDVTAGQQILTADISKLQFVPTQDFNGDVQFKFTVNDGHENSLEATNTLHIDPVADAATIAGVDTGGVTEDSFYGMQWLITKGQLTISDADTGEDKFDSMLHAQNNAGIGYDTKLGGHVLLSKDGSWQYNMDNFSPAVQKLAEGETAIDTVTIHSVDGTSHEIQVTITGTNDAPILGVNQTSSTTGTLTETDVDVKDTHTFSVVSSTGQFGSLSVDPNTGDYVYTPNTSITGMSYNSATNTYHGVDVFEVKVNDGHTEDSKFITFDASGNVTTSPTGGLVISTTVPQQPAVTATQPTLPSGTNIAPTNTVTLDLASTSDSGSSSTDNLTNDTTPTITGHTDIPFSKVTIYDGSTPVGHAVSDASGQYSVAVSSLSNGDHNLSAKALAPSSVMSATSSPLSVHIDTQVHVGIQTDPITTDNVINAQESNSSIDITGSVSGDFNTGDIVTLDVNGTQHTGVVDAKGHYSIAVPGSELIADADQKIEASVAVTDTAGNSAHATADVTYQVDTQVSVPTITFENAGSDNLYSKAEIARGHANTITATVTPPGDAKIGEHLVVNGQDHVLDAHTLQHGIQIEVHPGSNVQATMTDEHGNTAGSQGFAASAIPEPIIVRPPSGSHQVSGTLGVPPLLPSLTPVPTAQSGWRIHLPNGQYVTSHHGQYGTLTIDPQTGHLHYQEQAQVHTGPHGSASGIGQHEDKFEVALQGTNQDEVVAHVNIQILSHGPGHSGKLTVGTEVVDMTITPLVHTSHPAPPPPPPVQHDEPDMASQADFTVTLSDDSNLDLTQQTHQEPDQKTSHHGAAAYLDALGIKPDATSTTVHDQPADMDIVLAQVDQPDAVTHDQAHLDMSDALEHHDANINHNQDDEHHHHNDVDGLPDIDPNS